MSQLPPPPPPPLRPPTPPASAQQEWRRDRIGGAIASALIVVAALLPWASVQTVFGTVSTTGTDGDGAVTAVFGLIIAGMFMLQRRGGYVAAIVLPALVVAIGGYDIIDVNRVGDDVEGFASVTTGIGLYLTVLGGVAGLFCSISERRRLAS